MEFVLVGIVIWAAAGVLLAFAIGKAIHAADVRERRSIPARPRTFHTATRA